MRAGVLLAAGNSSRMGRDKALIKTKGMSFIAQGVRHLWSACDTVVVVLGARADKIREEMTKEFERLVQEGRLHEDLAMAHGHGAEGLEVRFETNPKWRSGMLGSVQVGLQAAIKQKPSSILVLPVDHPAVKPVTVVTLSMAMDEALEAYGEPGDKARAAFAYALVPRWKKLRGHPVALSPGLARAILRDKESHDLSDATRRNARLVGYLDVGDAGIVRNRNTPDD